MDICSDIDGSFGEGFIYGWENLEVGNSRLVDLKIYREVWSGGGKSWAPVPAPVVLSFADVPSGSTSQLP